MNGEVAQLAALVISANHRLAHPHDPMGWFATQRAFAQCGAISFEIAAKRRPGRPVRSTLAETPPAWLDQLARSGAKRARLGFIRQDDEMVPGETIPDRIASGFAGGGSLWTMTTETDDGRALGWRGAWKVAYPSARDGRVWSVRYTATAADPQDPGRSLAAATTELKHALTKIRRFATDTGADEAETRFAEALALLDGAPDPQHFDQRPSPVDTLSPPARHLLRASQRAWIFDNLEIWGKLRLEEGGWRDHARRSEALYDAVTEALVAAVNTSAPE